MAKIKKRLYHGFTFPTTLGFITPFLLAHLTLSMTTLPFVFSPHEVISLLCLVIAAVTSVILGIEYLLVPFKSLKVGSRLNKSTYVPIYCFYWILMTLLLWFWIRLGFSFSLIPMLAISIFFLIFLIVRRPYIGKVDTFGSICNIVLQISMLLVVKLRNEGMIPSAYDSDIILCFAITGLCICCFLFSIVRVILAGLSK